MSIFKPKIVKNYIANILSRKLNSTPFSPLFITLELTRKCNLKCKGCDLWRTGNQWYTFI